MTSYFLGLSNSEYEIFDQSNEKVISIVCSVTLSPLKQEL